MENNQNEQMIYLKDLIFSALYHWKRILIFGLILAVLLGGMKGIAAYRTIKDNTEIPQVSEAPEQTILEKRLAGLQTTLLSMTQYQEESVLMQIDPYNFYKVSLSIYVATEQPQLPDSIYPVSGPVGAILNSYAAVAKDETTMMQLSEALSIQPAHLQELVVTTVDPATETLSVVVSFPTQEGAEKILDILLARFEESREQIAQTVDAHQMSIYQQSIALSSDDLLAQTQEANIQSILALRESINTTRMALSNVSSNPPGVVSVSSLVRETIIYAIVGFILGMFVIVVLLWASHICSNKVYSARTLTNRTHIKVLGGINVIPGLGALMRKLRAMDRRSIADVNTQSQLVAAYVRNRCADSKHLLVSCVCECGEFAEALRKAMPGTEISVCGSLLSDVAAVDVLSQCDCVLLLEKCEVSRYADVEQSMAMVEDNRKDLLGCVLLNG